MPSIDFIKACLSGSAIISLIFFSSCKNESLPSNKTGPEDQDTLTLVRSYCGSCHSIPDPSILDRTTWNQTVLKNMGCRLGIQTEGYDPYRGLDMMEQSLLLNANIYPRSPLMVQKDWEKVIGYFLDHAPDSLIVPRDNSAKLRQFEARDKGDWIESPRVTMLYYDTAAHQFQVGLESGRIYTFSSDWALKKEINIATTPIQYLPGKDTCYILAVGVLYPSEQRSGSLLRLVNNNWYPILGPLHRPVWLTRKDMNQDKRDDFIVSEFGYETGQLAWFDSGIPGNRNTGVLYTGSGSLKSFVSDIDSDGKEELVTLNAQGNEGVTAYMGDEKGQVKEKRLLTFPAIFGVCDLDLVDFNGDHRVDIIISNGDNADYSQVNKPYHGIRIFLNRGNFNFEESTFIPYPGVLHTEIEDFDQDGDLDLAAVSFFPGDPSNPYPAFKYFKQTSPGQFAGQTFKASNRGKWMNMVKGDFDNDGDVDLLLGSFILNARMVEGSRDEIKKAGLLLLENQLNR